jgi:hypothetical protein
MTTYAEEIAAYEARLDTLRRGQLKAVQSTATKWSALMGALLGVFGTVAFAGGLTTVDKLPSPADYIVKGLTTAAAIGAVLAVWFLTRAAGGLHLTDLEQPNGRTLMAREAKLIKDSRAGLRIGKAFALATAGLVLAGSIVVLWTPEKSPDPKFLARFGDGATCGTLHRTGAKLTVGGRDVHDAAEIVPVAACP